MRIAYQYQLRPTAQQQTLINKWLDMLRHQYNWMLADRFDWWENNRCWVNACPLTCSIAELREQPEYYGQKRTLVPLKQDRPWYKEIHSQVLQDMVKRVKLAFDRYTKGDCNGKRSGRPRFKGVGRYRSFTYPQASVGWIDAKKIELPKIGALKIVWHRPIPKGFEVKSATLTKKADGWYVTLSLQDDSVPEPLSATATAGNTVGIDVGLKSFLVTSDGEEVAIPQPFRKAQSRLKRLQQSLSRKQKGSSRRKKVVQRVARAHLKVANRRKDFHYKTANKLVQEYQFIAFEKLNIKGLAKTRLAKSILDAGWGQFLEIVSLKAKRAAGAGLPQNPYKTTIECSDCGQDVPKTLADRMHICLCGARYDRDHNAARNVKQRAVGHPVQARGGDLTREPKKREARALCTA